MRTELELIEKIERYLNDQLTANERRTFEEQISRDPKLQEEVALQLEVMKGIERAALKQKVKNAGIRFKRGRNFTRWGFSGLILLILIITVLYYQKAVKHVGTYEGKALPEFNETGEKNWATADRSLAAQEFLLDAASDTVIETKGGIVLSIPANGFLDANGQPIKGKLELVVKEALDPASIIKAGLSTRSGNRMLETGGMFFLDARKDGERLIVNPSNGIYADVPTDSIKPGMQLFSGKRMPDSTIDWVNPKALEHALVPVDIYSLDFYPEHYLDSLKSWGYNAGNKVFADSLYFSLASYFEPAPTIQRTEEALSDSSISPAYTAKKDTLDFMCGINPAKIKTIWNDHFQNTLLSTREFEERIRWIHLTGMNTILDLYVKNLDRELSYVDSLAATHLGGESIELKNQFLSFASRHDGKVKNGNKQFDRLRDYYYRKAKAFTEAIAKTQRDFWNKERELDASATREKVTRWIDSSKRANQNFVDEFTVNLKDAYRQLGYDTAISNRSWKRNVYTVQVTNTGWCNIDRYVEESLMSRTSLDFTDPRTGKKASINYLPVSFQVEQSTSFDRLYVYLLPDKISSFMLVTGANGKYSERLNELMKYRLVCLGYKDEQTFFYSKDDIVAKVYPGITLAAIENNDLDGELNKMGSRTQAAAIQKENAFFRFEIKDQKRQKHNHDLLELRERLMRLIITCDPQAL